MTKLCKKRKYRKRWTVIPDGGHLWWVGGARVWCKTPWNQGYRGVARSFGTVFCSTSKSAALRAMNKLLDGGGSGTLELALYHPNRGWVGRHACWTFTGRPQASKPAIE